VVMADGAVRQVGSQRDLYERPHDRFVADFVGRSNFVDGAVIDAGSFKTRGGLVVRCPASGQTGAGSFSIRPERIMLGPAAKDLPNSFDGKVEFVSYLGAALDVHVALNGEDRVVAQTTNRPDGIAPKIGDTISIGWPVEAGRIFPAAS